MYDHVIISSEVKRPMELAVTAYETKPNPEKFGGGFITGIGYETKARAVFIWKRTNRPLCIDVWNRPVLDLISKPDPDREIELARPMPSMELCHLIAVIVLNADDIHAIDINDIPDAVYGATITINPQ